MLKVVISDHGFPSVDLERSVVERVGFITEEDVVRTCQDADVSLVQWAPVTKGVMQRLPKLRGVVRYGVGVNNLDLDAARELGNQGRRSGMRHLGGETAGRGSGLDSFAEARL
jgi:D-3-phosphoglycerate dehydrogenase